MLWAAMQMPRLKTECGEGHEQAEEESVCAHVFAGSDALEGGTAEGADFDCLGEPPRCVQLFEQSAA
jgi:hypothetical protein